MLSEEEASLTSQLKKNKGKAVNTSNSCLYCFFY